MPSHSVHEPTYSGTTTDDWDPPQLHDFDTDDLAAVGGHFVLSSSGFQQPEEFGDLALPVVSPDGELNANALRTAYSGGHGVTAVEGVDDDTVAEARDVLETLADEFHDLTLDD